HLPLYRQSHCSTLSLIMFFLHTSRPSPALHSFPTRRSSDLIRDLPRLGLLGGARPRGGDVLLQLRGAERSGRPSQPRFGRHVLRSEEHTSELQSRFDLVCRLLLEKKNEPPRTRAPGGTHDPA